MLAVKEPATEVKALEHSSGSGIYTLRSSSHSLRELLSYRNTSNASVDSAKVIKKTAKTKNERGRKTSRNNCEEEKQPRSISSRSSSEQHPRRKKKGAKREAK